MNNQTERFLTFAYNKIVSDEGFCYSFRDTEIECLPLDSELKITITFEGLLEVSYSQYEEATEIVDATETFPDDVRIPEIIKWLKSKIK